MLQDLRYAFRSLLTTRGLTAAAILSLALGIGANTSIFSVASALLLQPLPYGDPDRLVILWNRSPGLGIAEDWFSTAQYFDIRSSSTSFDEVGIALGGHINLTGGGPNGQAGAGRHGIARALLKADANLRPTLKAQGLLTRDPRMKERKKYGQPGARKRFQFSKR